MIVYILCFFPNTSLYKPLLLFTSLVSSTAAVDAAHLFLMSGHHHLFGLLNSGSDVDGDNDNDNDKSLAKTQLSRPPPSTVGRKREAMEVKPNAVAESSDHDVHIWTERERRKKMRNMFSNLHALLPHLPPKVDKSSIVDEAINYIKALQQTLQKLDNQKQENLQSSNNENYTPALSSKKDDMSTSREAFLADNDMSSNVPPAVQPSCTTVFQTWTSSNVVLSVCGGDAHFSVCSDKKAGLFAAVCYAMEKYEIEVVSAHVSSDLHRTFFMIQAHVNGVHDEFGAAIMAEETFKQAAGEIIFWLSS